MDYLSIALIVLAVAGIWAVVEIALTVRSARKDISEVASSANEVIAQAQPIVAKLDGMVDELEPAVKQATPIAVKANAAMDEAAASLNSVNAILADVSTVSGTAAGVTDAVNGAVTGAANTVVRAVKKVTGGRVDAAPALHEGKPAPDGVTVPEHAAQAARKPTAYVVYGEKQAPSERPAADDKPDAGQETATDAAPAADAE